MSGSSKAQPGGFVPHQSLVLFRRLPSPEWLSARGDGHPFRATAEFIGGDDFEGMGLISMVGRRPIDLHHIKLAQLARTSSSGEARALSLPPIPVIPIPPVPPVASLPPWEFIIMCWLNVEAGEIEAYSSHVADVGAGGNVAAGLLHGPSGMNFMVEVVAESADEAHDLAGALIKHGAVRGYSMNQTTGELTTGFGVVAD